MSRSKDLNIDKTPGAVMASTRRPRLGPETGWYKVGASEPHGVDFNAPWGNAGVLNDITHAPASWYLSHNGEARCRGVVDGGNIGEVIFTLPEEVRPEYGQTFICAIIGGGATANVFVDTNGDVILESVT